MNNNCLICVNTQTANNLGSIGLSGDFIRRNNILVECSGEKARRVARELGINSKVFCVSCDDLDAINLAAAIKNDCENREVYLLVKNMTGSLKSRTDACHLNGVIDFSAFKTKLEEETRTKVIQETQPTFAASVTDDYFGIDEPYFEAYEFDDMHYEPTSMPVKSIEKSTINPHCWIMSVFSGSGGAGKSTVSALSAQLFTSLGYKTTLLDFDLQFGDLKNAFKGAKGVASDELIKDFSLLSNPSLFDSDFPFMVTSPYKLESSELVSAKSESLISACSEYAEVIVINTGSCWSDIHAKLMNLSSASLFLIDQRVSSVRGCKHALELASRLNISTQSFKFALNRCHKKCTLTANDVAPAFGATEVFELVDGGIDVEEKMCLGNAFDLVKQKNALSISVFEMLKQVCPLSFDGSKDKSHKKGRFSK